MPFSKEVIGILVLALLAAGAYVWRIEGQLGDSQQAVGRLEGENKQLVQAVEDADVALKQRQGEMELWRGLYGQMQEDLAEVVADRAAQSNALRVLRENANVQDYLACSMPDELYDWVRKN